MNTLKEKYLKALETSKDPHVETYSWVLDIEQEDKGYRRMVVTAQCENIGIKFIDVKGKPTYDDAELLIVIGKNYTNCSSKALLWEIISQLYLLDWKRKSRKIFYKSDYTDAVLSGKVLDGYVSADEGAFEYEADYVNEEDIISIFDELYNAVPETLETAAVDKLNYYNRCREILKTKFGPEAAKRYADANGLQ